MENNKIVIVDYGMGNLRSVQKAFEKVGFAAVMLLLALLATDVPLTFVAVAVKV